jgi:hypothetical protein
MYINLDKKQKYGSTIFVNKQIKSTFCFKRNNTFYYQLLFVHLQPLIKQNGTNFGN